MTRAVVFDVGGVLLDLDKKKCISSFRKLGMASIEEMLDECHQKGYFQMLETGSITEDEFYDKCIAASSPGTTAEDVRNAFLSFANYVQPYKLEFLKELSLKYDLYVLSNNNPIVVRDFARIGAPYGVSFSTTFKKCFFSYEMKTLKPDPEFFRRALAEIGLPGKDVLFIDDNKANVEAAAAQGMDAVWYDISTNLRDCVLAALK